MHLLVHLSQTTIFFYTFSTHTNSPPSSPPRSQDYEKHNSLTLISSLPPRQKVRATPHTTLVLRVSKTNRLETPPRPSSLQPIAYPHKQVLAIFTVHLTHTAGDTILPTSFTETTYLQSWTKSRQKHCSRAPLFRASLVPTPSPPLLPPNTF